MKFELWIPIKPYTLTQGFGVNGEYYRANGINILGHNGLDLVGTDGQIIRASHDGVVTFTGEDGKGGLGVVIRTNEKYYWEPAKDWVYMKSIYWHCKPNTFKVKPGDIVKVGDSIAECDSTGFSTSSHLHWGVKPVQQGEQEWEWYNILQDNGYYGAIDPKPFFNNYYAQDAQWVISTMQKMIELLKVVLGLLTKK